MEIKSQIFHFVWEFINSLKLIFYLKVETVLLGSSKMTIPQKKTFPEKSNSSKTVTNQMFSNGTLHKFQ